MEELNSATYNWAIKNQLYRVVCFANKLDRGSAPACSDHACSPEQLRCDKLHGSLKTNLLITIEHCHLEKTFLSVHIFLLFENTRPMS